MAKKTPEGVVKQRIIEVFDDVGCYYIMPMGGEFGRNGVSDFNACIPHALVPSIGLYVEAKATKRSRVTELQKDQLREARDRGCITLIVHKDNVDWFERFVKHVSVASYGELQRLRVWAGQRSYPRRKPTETKSLPVPRQHVIRGTSHTRSR